MNAEISLGRQSTSIMKNSASTKSKSYRCLVKLAAAVPVEKVQAVTAMAPIALEQRNPTRVPRYVDPMFIPKRASSYPHGTDEQLQSVQLTRDMV